MVSAFYLAILIDVQWPSGGFTGAKEWAFILSELLVHSAESEVVGTSNTVLGKSSPLTSHVGSWGACPGLLLPEIYYLKKNGKGEKGQKEAVSKEGSSLHHHSFFSGLLPSSSHVSLPPPSLVKNKWWVVICSF